MGIRTLWSLIGGGGDPTDLRTFQGSSVAIDLAGWAVSGNQCKGMLQGGVSKPYLRNLFFRTSALLALNIKPVFVLDGDAPELKKVTLANRRAAASQNPTNVKSLCRNRLRSIMSECAQMLTALGVVFVRAEGEAEAYAAKMNAEGLVDAVITDDSDAFCYGAHTVLRNFTISGSNANGGTASVELYSMEKLECQLGLNRRRLIFMAITLGCDFRPLGVPGLGKETVRQILDIWPLEWDPIEILKLWHAQGFSESWQSIKKGSKTTFQRCQTCFVGRIHCSDCTRWREYVLHFGGCHCEVLEANSELTKLENTMKRRCKGSGDDAFWTRELDDIVAEFESDKKLAVKAAKKKGARATTSLSTSDLGDVAFILNNQKRPDVADFVSLAVKKLTWTEDYAVEKIIPVLTRWQVVHHDADAVLRPVRIVKRRQVAGVASYSVEWKMSPGHEDAWRLLPDSFESTEPSYYVDKAYPALVLEFEASRAKKKPSSKRRAKETNGDGLPPQTQKPITRFFAGAQVSNQREKKAQGVQALPTTRSEAAVLKDVTNSELYKRIFLESPQQCKQSTPKRQKDFTFKTPDSIRQMTFSRLPQANSPALEGSFCQDLSLVIEDILHEGERVSPSPASNEILASTPLPARGAMTQELRGEDEPSIEDSFDRMCL